MTLPKSAPYYKRFLNGDYGHAHALQEFGVRSALIGFSSFIPLLSLVVLVALIVWGRDMADNYWFKREVKQSKNMKRVPGPLDTTRVPDKPNAFWTADAIADYKFPKKMRTYYPLLEGAYVGFALFKFGLLGSATNLILSWIGLSYV